MSSRAQIVATIGPASGNAAMLGEMLEAGVDVARINFSHGTHESNGGYIDAIREAAERLGRHVPIIQDLAGPRMASGTGHAFDAKAECVTEKDLKDVTFGIEKGVDYIAQSFVGSLEDIACLKGEVARLGAKTPVIAKIERREAVDAIDGIIGIADALMVARGDLGLSVPVEDVPFIERDIIKKARGAGKPVITATQMLYTMIDNPQPTRAEVTDVAFAILLGSDAVMLSEETARGEYPLQAVLMMERIVSRAEASAVHTTNSL
ncbi:hypothetical protein A3A40_01615 [Candidatus Kaiserbacteria bacterium RIFCSPLOWO2_01_FULL_54_20]|uniref:pyruvate kinase n=1 Tax=Candidatus Kaiserbacteria bacterium RIFCSPLOWO2_01_FULL_54_20 TaxID=1798513 RepID=A0A1F6EJV7_9BACT|nr:MAG: hypothetical protein A3A40_01615 [Candidatus Kaiserbacteria bacterium RIFCSPLOWO2_01_FULL_54_20]